jgi:hypothetical protein
MGLFVRKRIKHPPFPPGSSKPMTLNSGKEVIGFDSLGGYGEKNERKN